MKTKTETHELAHGEWFALPRPPKLVRGQADEANALKWRGYRGSYDWKSYTAEQLPVMEAYWDACVRKLQLLLPQRLRADPTRVRGINLGTFNGAFQKAWMRLGYEMYGIEVTDVISELHEYGCSGERANFFNLENISDDQFDFAIMDRALFLKPRHAFFFDDQAGLYRELGEQMPDGSGPVVRQKQQDNTCIPPFFDEVFRVLKRDAAFAAIFYPYWSEAAMRELYCYGRVTFHPVQRRHPYLGISVDRAGTPTPFPEIEDTVQQAVVDSCSETVDRLSLDPAVSRVKSYANNIIRFHHIPTNNIVDLGAQRPRNRLAKTIVNVPDAKKFFFHTGEILEHSPSIWGGHRQDIALLLDRSLTGKLSERNIFLRQAGKVGNVVAHTGLDKGSKSLDVTWSDITEYFDDVAERRPVKIVLGHVIWDGVINRRSDKPRVPVSKCMGTLRTVIQEAQSHGYEIGVLFPPQPSATAEEPIQHQCLADFRDALTQLVAEFAVDAIDLNDAMGESERQATYANMLRSKIFRREAAILIREKVKPS
jgi:hypothetical protein